MKFETARWMPAMSRRGIQVLTSVVVTIAAAVALLLRAIPDLWVALEVDPMSAKTHAKAARVLIATWIVLEDEARRKARAVITVVRHKYAYNYEMAQYTAGIMWKPARALRVPRPARELPDHLARAPKMPQRVALRTKIVLGAAAGRSINGLAKEMSVTRSMSCRGVGGMQKRASTAC